MTDTPTPPLTAEEERALRDYFAAGGEALWDDVPRIFATLDAARARATELASELDDAHALADDLAEAAENLYVESCGGGEDPDRYLCHHCGVDLSRRGPAQEAAEHNDGCPNGRMASVLARHAASKQEGQDDG